MMKFSEWLESRHDACYKKVKARYKKWPSAYASGALVKCRKVGSKNWGVKHESIKEGTFDLEDKKGLHGWFSRNHGKGWIDCKQSTKDKKVPCGRNKAGKGTERESPACRPTFSACNSSKKKKKSSSPISWKKD
jgi:hypothetical protein